jgi:hypothetical protein
MPRKPKPAPDDPAQSKRFIDMGREIGADESDGGREAFERAFDQVGGPKPTGESANGKRQVERRHHRGKA